MERMWMVRGDSGRLFDEFREQSVVAIGWKGLAKIAEPGITRERLSAAFEREMPDAKRGSIVAGVSQVFRFINEMRAGDHVVTYNPSSRIYLLGKLGPDLKIDPNPKLPGMAFVRPATWQREIERDQLSINSKNSLGSILTVFMVAPSAASELLQFVSGRKVEADEQAVEPIVSPEEGIDTGSDLLKSLELRSLEFIKDKINQLDWAEMQELIAGVLRAMGYKTRVSPPGPDRGADIVASPDGLGFENPRIVVEVKHRSGSMGSREVRSFLGGRHKDDRGLYVSSGGFSKDAKYEADRASIPVTLWDLDDVVRALVEYYEKLDNETRQMVPLKRLYWPA